ncbi:transcriptional regulator opi1 [Sporothrix epigloea]|uniref:Transcriptional regulator opi1 n=1 Tax=Sporothrix epigloea TaxID=1892477 RepID=A0ABP0DMU3_9PEZI
MAPADAGVIASGAADDHHNHDASLIDRKALPSYSPPLYSQSGQQTQPGHIQVKPPLSIKSTSTPLSQDIKVLPFRDFNHTRQLPPIQSLPNGGYDHDARHKPLPSISSFTGSIAGSTTDSVASSATSITTVDSLDIPSYSANHWPSLNPLTAYYTPGHAQASAVESPLRMDVDSSSNSNSTGPAGATSPDRFGVRASSVSLEDPDVRMAAEALGDLRADFVSSPPARNLPLLVNRQRTPVSEPLFSLLTTSHPLLAKTIEGTTSAYNTSKNYSPRFKSGAEYVEGYLTPIGNTIGSVSRVTGVEGGVRWFLGGGRRRHQHQPPTPGGEDELSKSSFYKRRKLDLRRGVRSSSTPNANLQTGAVRGTLSPKLQGSVSHATISRIDRSAPNANPPNVSRDDMHEERRLSMSTVETLPAYDDYRSPEYTEAICGGSLSQNQSTPASGTTTPALQEQQQQSPQSQHQNEGTINQTAAWQSRIVMSTSGLSVSMSEESLRSLKYCFNWLRWAHGNIDKVIDSLKTVLDQYDSAGRTAGESAQADGAAASPRGDEGEDSIAVQAHLNELAARVATLRGDLLQTLRGAVDTVSKYAGGALPDNARVLVRRHLTSLPQRFSLANQAEAEAVAKAMRSRKDGRRGPASGKEVREGAQRVLVLAKEGLDMMSQVSGVLDSTIVSAEEWCERLGKKTARCENGAAEGSESAELTHITAPAAMTREVSGDVSMQ